MVYCATDHNNLNSATNKNKQQRRPRWFNGDEEEYPGDRGGGFKPRILLMGAPRSGKSSIQRVVFHKKSPHETMFLEPTTSLDIKYVANNEFAQFQIWDFPGDYDTSSDKLIYGGEVINAQVIFKEVAALVLVVDAQEDPIEEALHKVINTMRRAYAVNPNLDFEVFIHKVDGDLYLTDDPKDDCLREVQAFLSRGVLLHNMEIQITYYLTSIYDHSIFDGISKVVQKLIPQLPTLENMLNCLISSCMMEKSFLFDVVSRIYVATDSNPVHMATYELCCDMIDVAIDVSCIYGVREEEGKESDRLAYDDHSASIFRLSNGTVLYLRQVGSYLALVCLMQAEHFNNKEGLIEYNVNCFKQTLAQVFKRPPLRMLASHRASHEAQA
eukprot:jgi/Undpi1/8503/HiC_scaffold_25.g10970.m1